MNTPIMPTAEEFLEKGKITASNAVKSTTSDISDSVSGQIGLKNETNVQTQGQNQAQDQAQQQGESAQVQSERTKEMVRDFYSPSDDIVQSNVQNPGIVDEQQLAQVRLKLHQELHNDVYYKPLFAHENKQQVERPAEVAEEKKQQKMQELEVKQAKKSQDLAVQRAQTSTEINRGVSG